jgi:hypothetical protein
VELVYGAGRIDRRVLGAEGLLREWRTKEKDWGQLYLEYRPITPSDRLFVEDLAITMLINSGVGAGAARSIYSDGTTVDLRSLPDKPLEETTSDERDVTANIIGAACGFGIGASIATKTLHKKRPALIPVLDNRAIFGAYMNPRWPEERSLGEGTKNVPRIREALDWIAEDLTRSENASALRKLRAREPERSLIELFDMIWWMYFRQVEPVSLPGSA